MSKEEMKKNFDYNNKYTKKEMFNVISKYQKIQISGNVEKTQATFLIECREEKMPKQSQNAELLQEISKMFDRKLQDFEIRFMKKVEAKIDEKLQPIYERLDKIEKRLNNVEADIKMLKTFHTQDDEQYQKM